MEDNISEFTKSIVQQEVELLNTEIERYFYSLGVTVGTVEEYTKGKNFRVEYIPVESGEEVTTFTLEGEPLFCIERVWIEEAKNFLFDIKRYYS